MKILTHAIGTLAFTGLLLAASPAMSAVNAQALASSPSVAHEPSGAG